MIEDTMVVGVGASTYPSSAPARIKLLKCRNGSRACLSRRIFSWSVMSPSCFYLLLEVFYNAILIWLTPYHVHVTPMGSTPLPHSSSYTLSHPTARYSSTAPLCG